MSHIDKACHLASDSPLIILTYDARVVDDRLSAILLLAGSQELKKIEETYIGLISDRSCHVQGSFVSDLSTL